MNRADAALDLIANLALAGVAAAIVVRPVVVSRIASSPLLPRATALTRGAARRLLPASAPPHPWRERSRRSTNWRG